MFSLCRANICLVGDIPDILNVGHSVNPMRDGVLMHLNGHEGDNDVMRCMKLDCSIKYKLTPDFYWIEFQAKCLAVVKIMILKTAEMRPEFQRKEKSKFLNQVFESEKKTVN